VRRQNDKLEQALDRLSQPPSAPSRPSSASRRPRQWEDELKEDLFAGVHSQLQSGLSQIREDLALAVNQTIQEVKSELIKTERLGGLRELREIVLQANSAAPGNADLTQILRELQEMRSALVKQGASHASSLGDPSRQGQSFLYEEIARLRQSLDMTQVVEQMQSLQARMAYSANQSQVVDSAATQQMLQSVDKLFAGLAATREECARSSSALLVAIEGADRQAALGNEKTSALVDLVTKERSYMHADLAQLTDAWRTELATTMGPDGAFREVLQLGTQLQDLPRLRQAVEGLPKLRLAVEEVPQLLLTQQVADAMNSSSSAIQEMRTEVNQVNEKLDNKAVPQEIAELPLLLRGLRELNEKFDCQATQRSHSVEQSSPRGVRLDQALLDEVRDMGNRAIREVVMSPLMEELRALRRQLDSSKLRG